MKKVLFIFILLVFFNLVTVDAKTIITTTGSDKTDVIAASNDQIYPSIYNWNKEFDYPINYYDSQEGKLIPSIYSLNEKTTLENGKVYSKLVNNKDDGSDYQISKVLTIENDIYLMFGAKKVNDKYVPVINYYEKNILIWQYIYSDIGRGRFVSGVLDDGVIHCLGEYEQHDSFTTDILVIEISLTGVLNQMKLIKGNKNAIAYDIYKSRYGIYFVTKTQSHTLDYTGVPNYGIGVFLCKLSFNYELLNMFCVKNSNDTKYFSSMMVDEKLIVHLGVKGVGPFPYNDQTVFSEAFVSLDKYADNIDYYKLETNNYLDNSVLLSDDNSYYIGGYHSSKNEIRVIEYSKDFLYKKTSYFNIINSDETVLNIETVKIKDNHILIINAKNNFSDIQKYYYFCINKYMKKGDFLTFDVDCGNFINISFVDNYIYLTLTKKVNNRDVLTIYKLAIVKLWDRVYEKNEKEYASTFMTVNYHEINGENILYNDVFTLKTNEYYYVQNDGDLICINEAKVKMLPHSNIEEGTIYDLGKSITFNGKGYLNNIEVRSGCSINTPGFYILKQESEEGEIYITEFNIENLKTMIPDEKNITEKTEPEIINEGLKEKEALELKINGQINNNSVKNDFRIYVFVISTLVFLGISILLPNKFLRSNKK